MRVHEVCIALALVTGLSLATHAQSTQPVLKLPNDIDFKAPVGPGTQNAVLYGDPTKAGVYVQRTKFPPGTKVMPHWHPDEWRTGRSSLRHTLFWRRRAVGRKQAQGLSRRHILFRAAEDAPLRLGQGRGGHHPDHGHGANRHDHDPAKAMKKLIALGVCRAARVTRRSVRHQHRYRG
jgi:hypothetical protein